MELHLLDEAYLVSKKMMEHYPEDPDLELLVEKFQSALTEKEKELDRLEGMSLAKGL